MEGGGEAEALPVEEDDEEEDQGAIGKFFEWVIERYSKPIGAYAATRLGHLARIPAGSGHAFCVPSP